MYTKPISYLRMDNNSPNIFKRIEAAQKEINKQHISYGSKRIHKNFFLQEMISQEKSFTSEMNKPVESKYNLITNKNPNSTKNITKSTKQTKHLKLKMKLNPNLKTINVKSIKLPKSLNMKKQKIISFRSTSPVTQNEPDNFADRTNSTTNINKSTNKLNSKNISFICNNNCSNESIFPESPSSQSIYMNSSQHFENRYQKHMPTVIDNSKREIAFQKSTHRKLYGNKAITLRIPNAFNTFYSMSSSKKDIRPLLRDYPKEIK